MYKLDLNEMKQTLFERNWKTTIDVYDVWNIGEEIFDNDYTSEEFKEFTSKLVKKLKTYTNKVKFITDEDGVIEYENLIDNLNTSETLEDFNMAWEDLYEFADYNDIWLKTFI